MGLIGNACIAEAGLYELLQGRAFIKSCVIYTYCTRATSPRISERGEFIKEYYEKEMPRLST